MAIAGKLEHSFSYKGFTCYVVLRSYGDMQYRCGYVAMPNDIDVDMNNILCHGTITYSSSYSPDSVPQDSTKYYIGFDCMHFGDTTDFWTVKRVSEELRHIVNQILEQESEEWVWQKTK